MTKLISLSEAISEYVNDGDTVYAAGFTHLIPFAAGHEIIRQRKRDLVLARATPDLIYDQMVAAGCARKVIWSYMGNPGVGSLRIVRGAVERGELEWEEYSHFGMITRLQAGASGLPFLPMNQVGVQDLEKANPLDQAHPRPLRREGCDRRPGAQPGCSHRPRAARGRERQRPSVGHHRRAERSRFCCQEGHPDRRRDRRRIRHPLGPQSHHDPRHHRQRGLPCTVRLSPIVCTGLL